MTLTQLKRQAIGEHVSGINTDRCWICEAQAVTVQPVKLNDALQSLVDAPIVRLPQCSVCTCVLGGTT